MNAWTPAIISSAFVAALTSLGLVALRQVIKSGIETDFAKDLEKLKAALRSRDDEVAALRTNVMSGLSNRQSLLAERRLKAVEEIWASVTEKASLKALARLTQRVKMGELVKSAGTNQASRELGKLLMTIGSVEKYLTPSAPALKLTTAQPFVPPMIWALYSAHGDILMLLAIQAKMAAEGVVLETTGDETVAAVRAALPHMSKFIDDHGEAALGHLVEEIEDRLLAQIVAFFDGDGEDEAAVQRVARLASFTRSVIDDLQSSQIPIPRALQAAPVPAPGG